MGTKGVRDGVSVSSYLFKDVFKGLAPSVVGANKSKMVDFGRRPETGGISRTELRKNPLSQKPLVFRLRAVNYLGEAQPHACESPLYLKPAGCSC